MLVVIDEPMLNIGRNIFNDTLQLFQRKLLKAHFQAFGILF